MASAVEEVVSVLEEGLRVLRLRDGLPISDALVSERARNIVTALLGCFELAPLPPIEFDSHVPAHGAVDPSK